MIRSYATSAAATAVLLAGAAAVHAELIYGFNDPTLNGFGITYDQDATTTLSESLTTGVTESLGALHIAVGPTGGGYDQIDIASSTPAPADLLNASTVSFSATANYGNASYVTIAPVYFINGTTDGTTAFGYKALFASKTLAYDTGTTPVTETFTGLRDFFATARPANFQGDGLPATPADGDSTTALYSPAHIAAQLQIALQAINPNASLSVTGFALEETTNTLDANATTDFGDDLYIDNLTVPGTPEPASLAGLAIGGLLATRRRRGR